MKNKKKKSWGLHISTSDPEQHRHYSVSDVYSTNNRNTIGTQQKIKSSVKYGADRSRNDISLLKHSFSLSTYNLYTNLK